MKEKFKIKNCDRSKYIFLKACSNCLKVTSIITFIYMYILNMIWYFQNHALHNFLKNLHKGLVIVTKVAHSLRLCHDTDPSLRSYINMAILYFPSCTTKWLFLLVQVYFTSIFKFYADCFHSFSKNFFLVKRGLGKRRKQRGNLTSSSLMNQQQKRIQIWR